MNHKLLATALCCVSLATIAEEATSSTETSPYTASAELGLLFKTGDTRSTDFKVGFDLGYEKDQWTATGQFDFLVKKTEVTDENGDDQFETSDQKWTIVGQANYTLDGSKNYIYGNASYEDNRFNNFENQSSLSAGWGRRWYESEKATFDADIGPGIKRDVLRQSPTQDEETNTSAILQAQGLYKRKINEHVDFTQSLVAKYAVKSDENSTYKAETSISSKLVDTLQLKFSFIVDYNTEVEAESENVNTETSMTLVYSF